MSSIVCLDAHKNLNLQITNNSIAISPCCLTPPKKVNTLDFVNDPYLKEYRDALEAGTFPIGCSMCANAEARGVQSRRQASNNWYKDNSANTQITELTRLDYWTGDLCNLRCAICGPSNSSSWKEELNIHQVSNKTINKCWTSLDLETIRYIHFNGGEPLLNKEHINFLQSIPNKEQVHINYNTNGTVLPTNEMLALWEQFKLVQIDFSIDDIGDRFEYQRYPASWKKVTQNLQWFVNHCPANCMFAVNTTVSILNVNNLQNLNAWLQEHFAVDCRSDKIEHRQQPATGLLSVDSCNANQQRIIRFLDNCDNRRGTNWREIFPELNDIFLHK